MFGNGKGIKLPAILKEHLIRDMEIGEKAFTVSWAMAVDCDGRCYLRTNFIAENFPRGTAEMRIVRWKEGFQIFFSRRMQEAHGGHRYTPQTLELIDVEGCDLVPVGTIMMEDERGRYQSVAWETGVALDTVEHSRHGLLN